jgi:hypothetical protein
MEIKNIHDYSNRIKVQPLDLFRPVISGLIVNAYYSLLLLKKSSGCEISQEIQEEAIQEVFELYGRVDGFLQNPDKTSPQSSEHQER